MTPQPHPAEPPADCRLCDRLASFRDANRIAYPGFFNAPVPGFGDPDAWLLVTGLAPGLHGANRTGRPFTGDAAGDLLYATLAEAGMLHGDYQRRADDGVTLDGVFIANAVRCVPPQNKPLPAEIHSCRPFLKGQMTALPNLAVVLTLGQIAHQSVIKAAGGKLPKYRFAHGAVHRTHSGLVVVNSYHCSRYNTNTGRLTPEMFRAALDAAVDHRPA